MKAINKRLLSFVIVLAMVLSMAPVISMPVAAADTFASPVSDLVAAGTGSITCECGAVVPHDDWTAISMETVGCTSEGGNATGFELENGKHYYLSQDIYANTGAEKGLLKIVTAGRTACLHLNGKNLVNVAADTLNNTKAALGVASNVSLKKDNSEEDGTATGQAIIVSKASTLNIMGDGYVSSRENTAKYGNVSIYGGGTLNVYGGTYSSGRKDRLSVMARRGGAQVNIYGGTFLDPVGFEYKQTAHILIEGGTFKGYAAFSASASSAGACGGTITVKGGTFETDALATSNLTDSARANVKPVISGGTFTVDPASYLDTTLCIGAEQNNGVYEIVEKHTYVDGACSKCREAEPEEPSEPGEDPVGPSVPAWDENSFTTGFDPAGNDGWAYCEACYKQALAAGKTPAEAEEASLKEWTVFTGGEPEKNKHYYLNQNFEDYSATSRFMDPKTSGTYCWNLNGKTVTMATTTTEALCRVTTDGVLNIMDAKGTGVLAGYEYGGSGTNGGAAVEVRNNGIVNIYGGNFRRAEGSAANVAVGCHTSPTGQINIYGGTFDGVYTRTGLSIKLAGAPVITGLTVGTDVFANIDDLLPQAQITVKGSEGKVISNVSDNAAAVKDCFTAGKDLDVAVNADGALEIVVDPNAFNPETSFTTGFNPAGNEGKAYCEACYKQALAAGKTPTEAEEASLKEWTVFTGGNAASNKHYYLTENFENYSATIRFMSLSNDGNVCWNLNGYSVTMGEKYTKSDGSEADTEALTRVEKCTLNIMDAKGSGVLTGFKHGPSSSNTGGSVVETYQTGIVNIYGGTFCRNAEQSTKVAVGSRAGSGDKTYAGAINIYGGTIDGVFARTGGQAKLAGAPQITGLDMSDDVVVNIDDLLPTAQITVKGSAGTVISNSSTNAAAVKDCFTATSGLGVLVDENNALVLASAAIVSEDGTTAWYLNNAAAVGAYVSDSASYIQMYKDYELDLDGKIAYVAGEGKTITVSNGTLKGIDRKGEDTVTWVDGENLNIVTDFTEPFDGNRVVVLPVAEGYKSYNLSLALTAVTLRPGTTAENMGMYYKATLKCGPALAARVYGYGAVLSLDHMPGNDFMTDLTAMASYNDGENLGITAENDTVVLTTVLLKNIMKQDAGKIEANNRNSNLPVYANAYLAFDLEGQDGNPDMFVMAEESGVNYSLQDVVKGVDSYYASDIQNVESATRKNLVNFYNAWKDYGMSSWELPNIKAAAAETV